MKKNFLLSSLILSALSFSNLKGNVELLNNEKMESGVSTSTLLLKTEVMKNRFTIGAQAGFDGFKAKENFKENTLKNTKAFVKYDFEEVNNLNSYLKMELKSVKELSAQADLNYKFTHDLKLGANTKTTFGLNKKDFKNTYSNHKIYLEGKKDKYEDVKANLSVKHDYTKNALKNVELNLGAKYVSSEDLSYIAKLRFGHAFNGEKLTLEEEKDVYKKVEGITKYYQSYLLGAKYKGIKNFEFETNAYVVNYVRNINPTRISNETYYSLKPTIKYTGVENLTISSKNSFGGSSLIVKNTNGAKKVVLNSNLGKVSLNLGAIYDIKAKENLKVSPKVELTSIFDQLGSKYSTQENRQELKNHFDFIQKVDLGTKVEYMPVDNLTINTELDNRFEFKKDQYRPEHSLVLNPKFDIKYIANEKLELKAGADVKFKFDDTRYEKEKNIFLENFRYIRTDFETKISIKYMF